MLETATLDELEAAFIAEQYSGGRPAKAEMSRRGVAIAPWVAERVLEWPNLAAIHALEVLGDIGDPVAIPPALALAQRNAHGAPNADRLLRRAAVCVLARFSTDDARRWVRATILDRDGLDDIARSQLVTSIIQKLVAHGDAAFAFEVLSPLAEAELGKGGYDPAWDAARTFLAEPGARLDGRWMPLALALHDRDPTYRRYYAAIAARAPHPERHARVLAMHAANAIDDRAWLEALDPAQPDDHAILWEYLERETLAASAVVRLARTNRAEMIAFAARAIADVGATANSLTAHSWAWACIQLAEPALAQSLWDAEQAVRRIKGATSVIRTAKGNVVSAFEWGRRQLAPSFVPAKPAKKPRPTKPAKKPDDRYPFLFFGADPADWLEGANCGHRYQICFRGTLPKAKKSAFTRRRVSLAADSDCGAPAWGTLDRNTWAELCIGDSQPFGAMRDWLQFVHEDMPILEVVFLGARRENAEDAWTQWSYEQQPDGPRRAPNLGGEYDGFYEPAERV